MKNTVIILVIVFVFLGITGCDISRQQDNAPNYYQSDSGYPAQLSQDIPTGYPPDAIMPETPVAAVTITQLPTLGAVSGTIMLKGKPVTNVMVYLGNIVADDKGRELVAGYDRTSILRAATDGNGQFMIYNVPEGRYGLILDLVNQAYLLDTPDGTQSVLFSVAKGETTDLGVLDYSELPGL
jgi:hypothetical protein